MSIGFEFVAQPNGGSLSYDQFAALNKLITESGDANWSVRDPNTGHGELEVSSWGGEHYIIDAVGKVTPVRRWTRPKTPEPLQAGVNWWLNSSPDHYEDVVAITDDNQDALILSGLNDVMCVVWVDPSGKVRTLKGQWHTVYQEEEGNG